MNRETPFTGRGLASAAVASHRCIGTGGRPLHSSADLLSLRHGIQNPVLPARSPAALPGCPSLAPRGIMTASQGTASPVQVGGAWPRHRGRVLVKQACYRASDSVAGQLSKDRPSVEAAGCAGRAGGRPLRQGQHQHHAGAGAADLRRVPGGGGDVCKHRAPHTLPQAVL